MLSILLIGTGDTKSEELGYMADVLRKAGATVLFMDVSVLGDPDLHPDLSKQDVAEAAGLTIAEVIASGDENSAMALMAQGAVVLAQRWHAAGKVDGLLVLGGSMGTDLALDVAAALPFGVPKVVVSTIAFSHLIPPDRISTDLMMVLWAGGLYGLNPICQAVLTQACGAVVGAAMARATAVAAPTRPLIGMTSLGKSCLKYMVALKPALEARGYDVAVFHTTGMGGRAYESLAGQGGFAAVMDFSLQEVVNHWAGVLATSSGADRLENAGRAGIPQIVAPGAIDMVDIPSWLPVPDAYADRPYHAHNRLIGSVTTDAEGRRATARLIADKLARSRGPVALILPAGGIEEWDQPGEPLHNAGERDAFTLALRSAVKAPVVLHEIADHINSPAFAAKALEILDDWVAKGIVPPGLRPV